jgi:probable F420-dependent oxidoreductase
MTSGKQILFSFGDFEKPILDDIVSIPDFASRIQDLGYDGITIGVGGMGSGTGYDPFAFLAQAAVAAEKLLLSTSIFVLPLMHPLVLAQQVATLDILSQGRVIFGVGVGGERAWQFHNLGIPLHERGLRTDEAIEIMKGLWTNSTFSYHGKAYEFGDISLSPSPVQKPHPPILVGGRLGGVEIGPDGKPKYKSKTASMRRAAKYGDGWMPNYMTPEMYKESVKQIRAYATEYGREGKVAHMAHNIFFCVRDTYDEAIRSTEGASRQGAVRSRDFSMRYDILGPPELCIKRLEEYVDAGVRHFICKPVLHGDGEVQKQMELIATKIMPHFK